MVITVSQTFTELNVGRFNTQTHPTCCPPILGRLRALYCSLPPHWETGCTRTLQSPVIHHTQQRQVTGNYVPTVIHTLQAANTHAHCSQAFSHLFGPYCSTHIWEYCSTSCCHVTHLESRKKRNYYHLGLFKRPKKMFLFQGRGQRRKQSHEYRALTQKSQVAMRFPVPSSLKASGSSFCRARKTNDHDIT